MAEMADSRAVTETDTRRCFGLATDSTKWCGGPSIRLSREGGQDACLKYNFQFPAAHAVRI